VRWAARGPRSGDLFRVSRRPEARVKASLYRAQRQVVAGLLRDWSCSIVLGGANCNGRHAELVNKIKGPRFNTPTTNQEVGSSNLSGRANKSITCPNQPLCLVVRVTTELPPRQRSSRRPELAGDFFESTQAGKCTRSMLVVGPLRNCMQGPRSTQCPPRHPHRGRARGRHSLQRTRT
jgi:hypothetical protein